jgi:hypothetical protein
VADKVHMRVHNASDTLERISIRCMLCQKTRRTPKQRVVEIFTIYENIVRETKDKGQRQQHGRRQRQRQQSQQYLEPEGGRQYKTKQNKTKKSSYNKQTANTKKETKQKAKSKKRQRKTNKEMSLQEQTILRKSDGLKAFLCASH